MTIPVGFAQINFRLGSNQGGAWEAEVTTGVDISGNAGTLASMLDQACDIFELRIVPQLTSDVQFRGGLMKWGPDETGPSGEDVRLAVGGVGTPGLPPNVAWLIRKQTALGGRRGRGRWYIPGVPEAAADSNGALASASATAMNVAVGNFLTDMVAGALEPVVLHDGPAVSGSPEPAPTPITGLVCATHVATQRRRLRF